MRSPKPAKEDPAVVAARDREERRAESARTEETQALLMGATQRRLRRFGRVAGPSAGGSVPIYGGGGVSVGGSVGAGSGSVDYGTGSGSGGKFGGGGGSFGSNYEIQVY